MGDSRNRRGRFPPRDLLRSQVSTLEVPHDVGDLDEVEAVGDDERRAPPAAVLDDAPHRVRRAVVHVRVDLVEVADVVWHLEGGHLSAEEITGREPTPTIA